MTENARCMMQKIGKVLLFLCGGAVLPELIDFMMWGRSGESMAGLFVVIYVFVYCFWWKLRNRIVTVNGRFKWWHSALLFLWSYVSFSGVVMLTLLLV